jgi:ferritin-like metal-binding protein YciE
MSVSSMDKLLLEELSDLYSAEHQLTKALPKLVKMATSKQLQSALEHHLRETEGHVQRLEQAFKAIGEKPSSTTCEGMKGILEEGESSVKKAEEGDIRDLAIAAGGNRVEHYEMAAYGTVRTYAQHLGKQQVVQLLEQTLQEEKAADRKLTEIAEHVQTRLPRVA